MVGLGKFILVWLFIVISYLSMSGKTLTDSLMMQLDDVIARRGVYLKNKEMRLSALNREYLSAQDDIERFDILTRLYDEYYSFNTDSAYNISLRQEQLAERLGDRNKRMHARLNRACIFGATAMYHECLQLLDTLTLSDIPDYLHPYYFHIKRTVYGRMSDYAAFPSDKRKYFNMTNSYRDSIMASNDPASLAYIITKADYLNVNGASGEAIELLTSFMSRNDLSEHERAICSWTLSEAYRNIGNREMEKRNLIISAISDLKSSVREYISLRQLALMLYEEGDLDRAYEYMTVAVEDAVKCNARQRIIELNDSYPMINGIYVDTVRSQTKSLERDITIITIMIMLLIAMLVYMGYQMSKVARARKEVEEAYRRQNRLTEELRASNEKLTDAHDAIAEISELKEVYIGRYMSQCLIYIEKLDTYRKSLGKLVKSGKINELQSLLKSSSMIDDELKEFYDQFDRTFLNLFPSFIEEFNNLLLPEYAVWPKKEGSLNAELRIYALIRLGITDSDRIAKFLRYSLATIYNYKTKVKNKARGDRNSLESEVMKIGKVRRQI